MYFECGWLKGRTTYGVSEELSLTEFVGAECNLIGLWKYQTQFHFYDGQKSIYAESRWELRDSTGEIADQAMPPEARQVSHVHIILEQVVRSFSVNAPESFTPYFDNGCSLTIYDDSEQYETFSIHSGDKHFYI